MSGGSRLPAIAKFYVAAVVIAAVVLCALFALSPTVGRPHASTGSAELLAAGVLLAIAAFFAEIFPIRIPNTRIFDKDGDVISVSSSVYVASLLLYGPAFTSVVAATSSLASEVWRRGASFCGAYHKIAFNVSQYVLTVGLSGLLLDGRTNPRSLDALLVWPEGLLSIAGTVAAYFLLNTGLVSAVLAMVGGRSVADVWRQNNRAIVVQYMGMLNLGIVAAFLWVVWPPAVALLGLPLLILHLAFKVTAQLKEETMKALVGIVDMVESRDSYAYRHSIEVGRLSTLIATRLGLKLEDVEMVNLAAILHDIGKIGTPDEVLHKPGRLDSDERSIMELHPEQGAKVLQYFSLFRPGVDLVLYHQEHFDGSGYPQGLAGDRIPLGARIIHVADAYQAMTSDRVYRKALNPEEAVSRLLENAGSQFDPTIVRALVEVLRGQGILVAGGQRQVTPDT